MGIEAALAELRLRLLDLTGRNRLINFKHTSGRSIQFVNVSLEAVFGYPFTGFDQAAIFSI
jgi:hypothetical protein